MNLGFKITQRGLLDVVVFDTGGCRPATAAESVLWAALQEALAKAGHPAPTEPKPITHAACSLCGGLHGLMAPCATPAPTEPLVQRGTLTVGPEPDGSVRQVAIVGVAQGAYLSRCLVCELAGGCLCEDGPTYASPRPEPQHSDDGGGDGDDYDSGT